MKHTFDFHVHTKSLVITHWLNIEITVNVLRFCYFVCTEPHFCHISCSFKMTCFCADFFVFVHSSALYFLNSLRITQNPLLLKNFTWSILPQTWAYVHLLALVWHSKYVTYRYTKTFRIRINVRSPNFTDTTTNICVRSVITQLGPIYSCCLLRSFSFSIDRKSKLCLLVKP